ncbi:MAG: hydroxyacylglutathione hydrolase [Desulfobacteraceae bacterium]|nr:hydroxyacylglutathione hydrolase [Desulfobacteraceae bacterium]
MNLKQFRYGADNLGYVLSGSKSALVIDGGAPDEILRFAEKTGLEIKYIANTHSHPDHTSGNRELLENTRSRHTDFHSLLKTGGLEIDGELIEIIHTPGHTRDSVCFYSPPWLVSGDTLFNGKVGKCFTGDVDAFLSSVKKLLALPDDTLVYAGHDYVEEYVEFIRSLEPDNTRLDEYFDKYNPDNVCSLLADEKKVNPYLRLNDDKIISILKNKGLAAETEADRWRSLISLM